MARVHLPEQPPSFSTLRTIQRHENPSITRQVTNVALNGLDSFGPLVSALPRMLVVAYDHVMKKKRARILRVCGRLANLHAHATAIADTSELLVSLEWLRGYEDLVSRVAGFAGQYEKKRRVLLKLVRRVRSADDDNAFEAFHQEIDRLYLELSY